MKIDFSALKNIKNDHEAKAMVYGDQFLDKNSIGRNVGWSRENQNIPVFSATEVTYNPGGGGNLACNVKTFIENVIVCGLWGSVDDIYRNELEGQFIKRLIDFQGMVVAERTGVFGKQYLQNGIHVGRNDIDLPRMYSTILDEIKKLVIGIVNAGSKQVLVADYDEVGMGICFPIIMEIITENPNTITFGTSRLRIYSMKNFDFLFLNERELVGQDMKQHSSIDEMAILLMKHTLCRCLVVTHSGKGVTIYVTDQAIGFPGTSEYLEIRQFNDFQVFEKFIPSVPLKDIDPCGAGDTFMAIFSTAIMANYDVIQAANIGNAASRVVIKKKFGAAIAELGEVITEYDEIQQELSNVRK